MASVKSKDAQTIRNDDSLLLSTGKMSKSNGNDSNSKLDGRSTSPAHNKSECVEAGKRLLKARVAAGYLKVSSVCKEFGWNSSTFRAHERGQNPFTLQQAIVYGKAFNVSPIFLAFGDSPAPYSENSNPSIVGSVDNKSDEKLDISRIYRPREIDVISSGYWRKISDSRQSLEFGGAQLIPPFFSEIDPASQCDFCLRDSSMDRVVPNGFYLRCVKISDGDVAIRSGDLVVLERSREKSLRELSLRRLQFSADCLLLNPESNDRHWESIIIRNGKDLDGTDSRLIAKVLFVYNCF